MPSIDRGTAYPVLSSDWTGLSPFLIARFFPVERYKGDNGASLYRRVPNSIEVQAPLTDASAEQTVNWQSPFENMGPDQKFSSLSAMLQSGGLTNLLDQLRGKLGDGLLGSALDGAREKTANFEGRSGITKLNSTQIFNGMPPLKINVTAHFRALRDSQAEVSAPMDQLMKWALPQLLAADGVVASTLKGEPDLYPSRIPQLLGMQYADCSFKPIVIESIPYPLSGPRDSKGRLLAAQMTMSLASLTAIDKFDWEDFRTGRAA